MSISINIATYIIYLAMNDQVTDNWVRNMKNNDFSWKSHELKEPNGLGKIVAIPVFDDTETTDRDISIHKEQPTEDMIIDDFKERISMMISDQRSKKE